MPQYSNPFQEGQYPSAITGMVRGFDIALLESRRKKAEDEKQREEFFMMMMQQAREEEELAERRQYEETQEAEERKYKEGREAIRFERQKTLKGMPTGAVAQRQGAYSEWSTGDLLKERNRIKDADTHMNIQRIIKERTKNERIKVSEFGAIELYNHVLGEMKAGELDKDTAKAFIISEGYNMKHSPFNQLLTKKTLDELIAEIIKPILKERQGAE